MQAAHFRETFQWLVVRTTRARTAGSSYVSQQTRTSPWLMVRTMGLTNSRAKFRFLGDKDFPVAHGPNNRGTNSRAKFRFERDKNERNEIGMFVSCTHLSGKGDAGLSCVITGSSVGASTVADCTSQASKMARLFREKNPRVVVHEVNRLTTREGTRLKPHLDIETDGEVLVVDLAVVLDAYEGVIKDKARKRHRRMLL
ncbi:uncharacterized protein [Dermacentor albipictus]|uniref:uncharacterized protein isoform X2 n=1 Tax=Dermacentor albipictus TaxID=60249 RepID=UPI0038FC02EA